MRGLPPIPSQNDLVKTYNDLHQNKLTESSLLKALPQCRFDPRLAEILVHALARDWERLNPLNLNDEIKNAAWPQILGVLLENAEHLIPANSKHKFRRFKDTAMWGIPPANGEQFWIGVDQFASARARKAVERSHNSYLRWGFYGDELLINKAAAQKITRTLLPANDRLERLLHLAQNKKWFTLQDCLKALDQLVLKRTAEIDLQSAKFLIRRGRTKGRLYRLR